MKQFLLVNLPTYLLVNRHVNLHVNRHFHVKMPKMKAVHVNYSFLIWANQNQSTYFHGKIALPGFRT